MRYRGAHPLRRAARRSAGAAQPFRTRDGRYLLTYNGEVENHRELRAELASGWDFQTRGDVEVVLAAYARWGEGALSRFDGMFAFCVWDSHREEAFVARDRLGVKPLVHARTELCATTAWLAKDRDALFARHGLAARFRVCDCLSPDLTIAFTTEALVGDAPDGVVLAGPSRPRGPRGDELDFPWNQLENDRPFVYVSLGSQVFHQPRIFAALIEAARGEPYSLVISAGDLAASIAAPGVCAVPYAPQLALLPRAAAMVTPSSRRASRICRPIASTRPTSACASTISISRGSSSASTAPGRSARPTRARSGSDHRRRCEGCIGTSGGCAWR